MSPMSFTALLTSPISASTLPLTEDTAALHASSAASRASSAHCSGSSTHPAASFAPSMTASPASSAHCSGSSTHPAASFAPSMTALPMSVAVPTGSVTAPTIAPTALPPMSRRLLPNGNNEPKPPPERNPKTESLPPDDPPDDPPDSPDCPVSMSRRGLFCRTLVRPLSHMPPVNPPKGEVIGLILSFRDAKDDWLETPTPGTNDIPPFGIHAQSSSVRQVTVSLVGTMGTVTTEHTLSFRAPSMSHRSTLKGLVAPSLRLRTTILKIPSITSDARDPSLSMNDSKKTASEFPADPSPSAVSTSAFRR